MWSWLRAIPSFFVHLWRLIVTTPPTGPVINSVTFDQPGYITGATVTATVNYTPGTSDNGQPVTFTELDTKTGLSGTFDAILNVLEPDQMQSSVSDPTGRKWTLKSDTGSVAVLTATA